MNKETIAKIIQVLEQKDELMFFLKQANRAVTSTLKAIQSVKKATEVEDLDYEDSLREACKDLEEARSATSAIKIFALDKFDALTKAEARIEREGNERTY